MHPASHSDLLSSQTFVAVQLTTHDTKRALAATALLFLFCSRAEEGRLNRPEGYRQILYPFSGDSLPLAPFLDVGAAFAAPFGPIRANRFARALASMGAVGAGDNHDIQQPHHSPANFAPNCGHLPCGRPFGGVFDNAARAIAGKRR